VTPSEHLGLPDVDDVRLGVVASKIAAHAGDLVKLGGRCWDDEMSCARRNLDWEKMFELAVDREIRKKHSGLKGRKECSMCGEYCALKIVNDV